MKRQKAILVTVLMTIMLIVILAFMLLLDVRIIFFAIGGLFAVVGIVCTDVWLLDWLTEEDEPEELQPVEVAADPVEPDETELTYEAIRDALEEQGI